MTTLWSQLEIAARAEPARIAVVAPDGTSLTYGELHDRASRVASFLSRRGIGRGDRVAVVAAKSADVVATFLGIMRVRAAYVPIDHGGPLRRARTILEDCGVRGLFAHGPPLELRLPEMAGAPLVAARLPTREEDGATGGDGVATWDEVLAHPAHEGETPTADDLAYILYTSGSTGVPKGVELTHTNATSFVDWCSEVFAPSADDRFSSHAPFHFDLSILDLYVALKHGASVHLVGESTARNPRELSAFIAERRITVWYSTPSILSALTQFGELDRHDCSSVRTALFAGEVFPVKHLREIVARWPHATFYNLYGPTETNVCTFHRIPAVVPDDRAEPYPIGRLCSHCEGRVLDEPHGADVAPGAEGLLHIAGASLFRGYWGRPTEGLFHEKHGVRWYNTGDVVRETDDGYVYVGRRDRMVKRRGYRIELGEVERALYENPDLVEAAVVAVPDASSGVRIVAFVAPAAGATPTILALKAFSSRNLLAYMIPDAFRIVEALPRTSTDKVDYQALGRSAAAPA